MIDFWITTNKSKGTSQMTYKHLTTRELTLIVDFWHQGTKAYQTTKLLKRSQETIYRIYRFVDSGKTIEQYLSQYQRNKRRCGRKQTKLPSAEIEYIHAQIRRGWTHDTIIGRTERPISCSMRTLYRMFARGQYQFHVRQLPMKGKRHPNGYVERRGKAGHLGRSIYQRFSSLPRWVRPLWSRHRSRKSPSRCGHDLGRTSVQSNDCPQCAP